MHLRFRPAGLVFALLAAFASAMTTALAADAPRERVSLNAGWRFTKDDPAGTGESLKYQTIKDGLKGIGNSLLPNAADAPPPPADLGADVAYAKPDFDDSGWRQLNLPHDWGIEGPFKQELPGETGKLPWFGVGWYRKHFNLAEADRGRQLYLDIDGAMSFSSVWINGKYVGGWPYGYSSYRLDLTPHVRPGADNVVAIRLDNPPDSSRWYPGGGIYRNVWLTKTNPVHVAQWGTSVTTPQVTDRSATVELRTTVENRTGADATLVVRHAIHEVAANGKLADVAVVSSSPANVDAPAGKRADTTLTATVPTPRLWDTERPNRYAAVTTVEQDGRVVDRYETMFGIRTIKFTPHDGFQLNGKRVAIRGVCQHHDLGALGAAINIRAMERQIELLKEMGTNAIRMSHNPPAPELLDLCDRMGILVMDEVTDTWLAGKKPNGYHRLYGDWYEKDLRAMIRRDRNHPSVVLWSTGNEVNEQRTPPAGHEMSARHTAIARDEDPTRETIVGCNHPVSGFNGFQHTVGVFGFNYKPRDYARFRAENPDIPLVGSETVSTVSTRGEYVFPVVDKQSEGKADYQVSSYDFYAPGWGSAPEGEFRGQDENPFVAGEFVWTGFDYLGEPTPFNSDLTILANYSNPIERDRALQELKEVGKVRVPSRSSYFGIFDLAGFRKDRFYIYQARWRPDVRMAHILPHWNWPERVGQVTPVHVYTSGDEAELFLNGRSLGRQSRKPLQYRFRWDAVKYEPGELKVVTYKDGKPWADTSTRTTGPAAKLTLSADRGTIAADGSDLSFVTLTVIDASGQLVPRSKNRVTFAITGPADIIATDNGDPTSHEPFQVTEKNAFNGLCLAIVRSKAGEAGRAALTASADGLEGATVEIVAQKH